MNLNSKLTACTIALSMFFFSNVNNSFATVSQHRKTLSLKKD
ncbi:hypothetical protein CLV36_11270 [Laceyella sediminis]|uniref:Uncharacterized protein n=1 Tax=Laceyella sediminis TaxID=573074 RepID=A0ABX5ENC7_9BACL|nr:hypothetical protein CLV36_11270 [Laceyella sediminis]